MTSDQMTPPKVDVPPLGFSHHDHETCVRNNLAKVVEHCEIDRLRLTPVRRKVLEILLQEHRALGAYAILDLLREAGYGSQPTIAYRALDFLAENGFVHRIETLNAFVACSHPGGNHSPAFMICRLCAAVAEAPSEAAQDGLGAEALATGFQIERTVVEAEGVCPACADKAGA